MADLTVMTWNIQNLFPVGHQDGPAAQQEYRPQLPDPVLEHRQGTIPADPLGDADDDNLWFIQDNAERVKLEWPHPCSSDLAPG